MISNCLTKKEDILPLLEITDERVAEMLQTIKPLVRHPMEMCLYEIELPADLRHTGFRVKPNFTKPFDMQSVHELERITTYHKCGYHMFFKPDIVEALAQIDKLPDEIRWQVVAFDVLFEGVEVVNDEFYGHRTTTVLYRARDNCSICKGAKGGVAGNGNIINGAVVCDYCHAAMR